MRFHDLVDHIERVQRHARHAEQQAESAVQLYFAAMTNRTSEVMRTLTMITAVFMPLNGDHRRLRHELRLHPRPALTRAASGCRWPRWPSSWSRCWWLLQVAALAVARAAARRSSRSARCRERPRRTSIVGEDREPDHEVDAGDRASRRRWSPRESQVGEAVGQRPEDRRRASPRGPTGRRTRRAGPRRAER